MPNINNIALVIPIYPPHYNYMYNLLNLFKINDIKIDTYLIFSNNDDYLLFSMKDYIKPIFIPQNIIMVNVPVFKKLYALDILQNNTNYDNFIVIDSEITIIPENFTEIILNEKINNIFLNKVIYAGYNNTDQIKYNINKISAIDFINNHNDKIIKDTLDFRLYFWWSDLPVYKREHLKEFFNLINYKKNYSIFGYFETIVYQYYLIIYHNFQIINLSSIITNLDWSLECFYPDDKNELIKLENLNYGFSYIREQLYLKHKNFLDKKGSLIIYHLDRK